MGLHFVYSRIDELTADFICKSTRNGLVPKKIVDKNGVIRTVYVNPGEFKHQFELSKFIGVNDSTQFNQRLNKLFLGKKTKLGTYINEISYEHLEEHKEEREFDDPELLSAVRKILEKPLYYQSGSSKQGSTEYWGSYESGSGETVDLIVVVKDRHKVNNTNKGCLLTIINKDLSNLKKKKFAEIKTQVQSGKTWKGAEWK